MSHLRTKSAHAAKHQHAAFSPLPAGGGHGELPAAGFKSAGGQKQKKGRLCRTGIVPKASGMYPRTQLLGQASTPYATLEQGQALPYAEFSFGSLADVSTRKTRIFRRLRRAVAMEKG